MQFYKIVFHEIPQIVFAHSHRSENYKFEFNRPFGNMEITYIKEGDIRRCFPNNTAYAMPAPSIATTIFDGTDFTLKSDAPLHIHYTFALKGNWSTYKYSAEDILSCIQSGFISSESQPLTVLLPDFTTDDHCISALAPCFLKLISAFSDANPFRSVSSMQYVFRIFSGLTEWCINEALRIGKGDVAPSAVIYCRRATTYMQKNIHRTVTAKEIAEELQVSLPHLSRIFKSVTGKTLTEYNNHIKITQAKQLLESGNIPIRDIAQQVGFQDEKYFSRLFKNQTGMTAGAYKRLAVGNPSDGPDCRKSRSTASGDNKKHQIV